MAYIINRFDGTQLTIVDDGILDTSTPVGLIGRNYTGYGEVQNENFIFLLENFANASPPARALSGQAWYDKGAKALKVYNGTTWLSIGNATVSETEPAHSNGGLWLKTTTQQLFVSDGITWRQVGPEAAEGFSVTKMTSTKIKSATGAFYPVILTQINGVTTAIHSDQEFTISADAAVPGFTVIYPGLNYPNTGISSSTVVTQLQDLLLADSTNNIFNNQILSLITVDGIQLSLYKVYESSDNNILLYQLTEGSEWVLEDRLGRTPDRYSQIGITNPTSITTWYDSRPRFGGSVISGPTITGTEITSIVNNVISKYAVTGNLRGNADTATLLQNAKTINGKIFNGSSNIEITAATNQPLKAGDFIIGSEFNGAFETTWDINATSENIIGTVVARNSVGGFSATTVNADLFGNVQGNVTAVTGTSTFNNIVVDTIEGGSFSGVANRAIRLETARLINTVPFNGTENITLPVPAETLVGNTLAPNVVDSVLTSLGKLVALEVEAPGIIVGDGNNLNIKIEGFTPTLESDVSNAIKLKLLTGSVTVAPTTLTFISANAANADGVLSPAFVPDYTLTTPANQRPVLGLPSHRWKDIYSAAATLDVLKATTLSGRTLADEVTVSNKLIVNNGTYSALFGNVTGNLTGNVTGAASLNMLKSGDTLTGDISWTSSGRGLAWSMNTDTASIRYYNTADGSTDNRLEFNTGDNTNEFFRWTHTLGASTYESMRLTPNSDGGAILRVSGQITVVGGGVSAPTYIGDANQLTNLNATQLLTGTIPTARLTGTYNISIAGNVAGDVTGNLQGNVNGNVTGSVIGSASLNVLKTGDTLTGDLAWSIAGRGLTWGMNSDGASIRFYNVGDGDTASRLEFQTSDNGNEYFSWTHALSGGGTLESMRLTPNSSGNAALRIYGNVTVDGTANGTFSGTGTSLNINADRLTTGTVPLARLSGTYNISISGNANTATTAGTATNQAGGSVNATTGSFSGRVAQSVSGFHAASKEVISTRTDSGFYDWPNPTTANGWPVNGSWHHLLSSTHVNDANYYAMQFSADFYAQNLYYRSTGGSGATAWNKILHSTNFNDYAPTKAGAGATGTWNISILGNANTVTNLNSAQIVSALGYTPVNPGALTNQSGAAITGSTATFSGQVNVSTAGIRFPSDPYGGGGDYAGITYESVGGERTRLRFTVANDAGITSVDDKAEFIVPDNNSLLVNGHVTLNAANYNNYSPTLSGTGATGTWPISVTGNAGSASSVAWTGVTNKPSNFVYNDGGTYGINISGNAASATGTTLVYNEGNITAETNGFGETSGLRLRSVYSNGYPTSYGNVISMSGAGGGQLLVGWSGSTGAHADNYVRSRRDVGTTWSAWAKLITDVNYNSYSPTLTGGNASGTWGINITGNANTVTAISSAQITNALGYTPVNPSTLTNTSGATGSFSTIAASGDITITKSQPTIFFNDTGDSAIELAIRVNSAEGLIIYEPEDGSEWFRIDDNSNAGYLWSSQILTANNYNTYAPTKTGTGASGTWPISISGNAVTVTSVSYQQVVNALGFTPANQSDLTRVTTSPLQASNITATGTLTVAQGAGLGIRWPNDAFGGGGDTASITLESAGGEGTRMRFSMTNDSDDYFEFTSPNINGMKMNSWSVLNDGNLYIMASAQYVYGYTNTVGYLNFGSNYFDVYPPAGYTMANLVAFIPSIHVIYFAGGVNGDDVLGCVYSTLSDRVRVFVQNSEQRSAPAANYLAIWRR